MGQADHCLVEREIESLVGHHIECWGVCCTVGQTVCLCCTVGQTVCVCWRVGKTRAGEWGETEMRGVPGGQRAASVVVAEMLGVWTKV